MKILIYLLILIFPLGQLARINLFGGEVTIHLNDLVVGLTVLLWFLKNPMGRLKQIRQSPLFKPITVFVLFIAVSLAANFTKLNLHQFFISSLYALRWVAYAGLFFVFSDQKKEFKLETKRWLIILTLIIATAGLLQYIFLPDIVFFLKENNWDDHYFRLLSTFLDPGFTGGILVLGLVLICSTLKAKKNNLWQIVQAVSIYVALALTYSRASYLMYLVSFGTVAVYKKSVKIFLIAIIVLVVTIPLLPKTAGEGTKLGRENSVVARIRNWQESVRIWQTHPIFGVGFDAYRYVKPSTTNQSHSGAGADSSLLLVLATTGMFGFLSYLWLLGKIAVFGRKNFLFMASFVGVLVHSFFNNTLFYPWVMEWLWILLAISEA